MTPKTFSINPEFPSEAMGTGGRRRIAFYARVSSEDQRERQTVLTQLAERDRFLAQNPEFAIYETYVDDGVSGTVPFKRRAAGARLLEDAARGRFSLVVVYRFDRLGRDDIDPLEVRRQLETYGVSLQSIVEGEVDPFMYQIYTAIGAKERRDFLRRSADGLNRAADEGRYVGGIVAYGYRVAGEKKDSRLIPDDEAPLWADKTAADIVRWMFERCAIDGWSSRRIADELNGRGVPTHYARAGRGLRKQATRGVWRQGRVYNLLTEPVYKGLRQYGRRSKRPRDVIETTGPALVTKELWQAAQDMLAAGRLIPKNSKKVYLLRSLIRCSVCGLKFHGTNGRDGARYTCGGRQRERSHLEGRCYGRSLAAKTIEPLVLADVRAFLTDPGDLLDELRPELDGTDHIGSQEAERASLQRHLDDLHTREDTAIRLCTRGTISERKLDELLAEIATERRSTTERLAATEEQASSSPEPLPDDLLTTLRARIDELTPEEWQGILQHLVGGITVHTTLDDAGKKSVRIVVDYLFPEPVACVPPCTGTRARFDPHTVLRARREVVLQ